MQEMKHSRLIPAALQGVFTDVKLKSGRENLRRSMADPIAGRLDIEETVEKFREMSEPSIW